MNMENATKLIEDLTKAISAAHLGDGKRVEEVLDANSISHIVHHVIDDSNTIEAMLLRFIESITEQQLAMTLEGPWGTNEYTPNCQLDKLRDIRWQYLKAQERGVRLAEARSVLRELKRRAKGE